MKAMLNRVIVFFIQKWADVKEFFTQENMLRLFAEAEPFVVFINQLKQWTEDPFVTITVDTLTRFTKKYEFDDKAWEVLKTVIPATANTINAFNELKSCIGLPKDEALKCIVDRLQYVADGDGIEALDKIYHQWVKEALVLVDIEKTAPSKIDKAIKQVVKKERLKRENQRDLTPVGAKKHK